MYALSQYRFASSSNVQERSFHSDSEFRDEITSFTCFVRIRDIPGSIPAQMPTMPFEYIFNSPEFFQ